MADPAGVDHTDYRLGKARLARGSSGREGQGSI